MPTKSLGNQSTVVRKLPVLSVLTNQKFALKMHCEVKANQIAVVHKRTQICMYAYINFFEQIFKNKLCLRLHENRNV